MDSVKHDQVGVSLEHLSISPLSLRERARVRALLIVTLSVMIHHRA
jgi:hypothetical protein